MRKTESVIFMVLAVACITRLSTTAWSGPCYTNTYADARAFGCTYSIIKPDGLCPSSPDTKPTPCSSYEVSRSIVIGTSGNEASGKMSQDQRSDACWLSYQCETVYTMGGTRTPVGVIPIGKQSCQIKGLPVMLGSWTAMQATGEDCVRGPDGAVPISRK